MTDELNIKNVVVIGAGTMGLGIAQVCATAGFSVQLFDLNEALIQKALTAINQNLLAAVEKKKLTPEQKTATYERISVAETFLDIKADLAIEAIIEKLESKQKLMADLEKLNPGMILATNTSTFPISQVAAMLNEPSHCIGLHFFNPAHVMKLVEVISGEKTSQSLVAKMKVFCKIIEKHPVFARDSPGFIVNRVARSFYVESLKIMEEQGASTEGIDRLMKASGFKMGPFELMDLIGVDTNLAVTTSLYDAMQVSRFKPSAIQQKKVNDGHWGRKTGKGFYEYPKN